MSKFLKFIRKNDKKFLAVFSVGLMIMFVVQQRSMPGMSSRESAVIGRFDDQTVTEGELESVHNDWRLLRQSLVVEYPQDSGRYVSFLALQFPAAQAIDSEGKLYLLLLKEADRAGIVVSDEETQQFLLRPGLNIQLPSGSVTRFDQVQQYDADFATDLKQATTAFLRVTHAGDRLLDLCKIPRAMKDLELAEDHQNIAVRYVSFDATQVPAKLPVPSQQDLQKLFDQYASAEPTGSSSTGNPLGLGYRIPDQVKLQTLVVTYQQLVDAVQKSKSAYDWKVQAWEYYLKHQADFPTTKPSSPQPPPDALVTLPSTQPTTKPFDQVQALIQDKVMEPDIQSLHDRVQEMIATTMTQDWNSYHAANPSTQPTTAPSVAMASTQAAGTSSLGVPYNTYEYLTALAAKVQAKFNILPITQAYNQPMTLRQLSKLPEIGATHPINTGNSFAMTTMAPEIALLQPSPPLTKELQPGVYFFRVTDRIPSHPPAKLSEVAQNVTTDWLKVQQYQSAVDQAKALKDAAAKVGLLVAAKAGGELVKTTAPFSAGMEQGEEQISDFPLAGDDLIAFREKCRSLMEQAADHQPPVAVVEAPTAQKILVVELAEVKPDWEKNRRYIAEAQATGQMISEIIRPLQSEWYTLPSVEARLGYKDSHGS
jgi:hypothetical protein